MASPDGGGGTGGDEAVIISYRIPLALVASLKYLRRVLLMGDNALPAEVSNLRKSQRKWARLTRVLIREGVYARTLVHIYLALVQLVMIYGSETWVMSPRIGIFLGGFNHRVVRSLTGGKPQ